MHPVDDMYRLLLEREQAFQDKTQEVFAYSPFLCDAIVRHLDVEAKVVKWISIDMIGVEIVVMVSIPDPNHELDYVAPGQEPIKVLTIVIPCSVVDTCESETISQFLDETFDIRQSDGEHADEDVHGIIAATFSTQRILH